jgi:hypothetical protein
LAQSGLERIINLVINAIAMLVGIIGQTLLNAIGRNQNILGELFILGIVLWGLRTIFMGPFRRPSSKK